MMKLIRLFAAVAAVSLAGCSSLPGSGTGQGGKHAEHHSASRCEPGMDPSGARRQMNTMHEMHQKMMAARTPAERAALMKDHMKAMQDGMAMMNQMGNCMPLQGDGKSPTGEGSPHRGNMAQRMDMMEMMMQMMVDREAVRSPAR